MNSEESFNHLRIHCGKAKGLWHLLFFSLTFLRSCENFDKVMNGSFARKHRKMVWMTVPICLFVPFSTGLANIFKMVQFFIKIVF